MKICPFIDKICLGEDCVNFEKKRRIEGSLASEDMELWAEKLRTSEGTVEFNREFPVEGYCRYFKVWLGEQQETET